jgi:hypothetical protein
MLRVHAATGHDFDISLWLYTPPSGIQDVAAITASGSELVQCCEILGRRRPNSDTYVFVGDNAREIVLNWQTQTKNTSKHTKT